MIQEVLIIGGTHGNEKTGIYISEHIRNNPIKGYSFSVHSEIGNPEATSENRRYIDFDFNRSFYNPEAKGSYEEKRAKELESTIKEKPFVIDLHTTTSNMGVTYILSKSDPLTKEIAFLNQRGQAGEFILETKGLDEESHFVNRISDHGLMIEIGPVAQNYFCAKTIERTWHVIQRILKNIDSLNKNGPQKLRGNFNYYKEVSFLDFPRDSNGKIASLVHPYRQGKDYQVLKEGEPLFFSLPEKTLTVSKEHHGFYPCFINEAAYYEKNMAMMLCERKVWQP